jgi:hypothetical protein
VAATGLVWAVFVLSPVTQFFLLLGDFLLTAAQLTCLFLCLPLLLFDLAVACVVFFSLSHSSTDPLGRLPVESELSAQP